MSLAHDLETLRKLCAAEIHTLHLTYLRSKRTLIRTTSPSRLIRQNVAAALGIATTLGLLIAPRTGSATPTPSEIPSPAANPTPEKPAPKHTLFRTLLKEAAALLLSKIDLKKIIALALETITHSTNQNPNEPVEPTENPHINAPIPTPETLPTNTLDDFQ